MLIQMILASHALLVVVSVHQLLNVHHVLHWLLLTMTDHVVVLAKLTSLFLPMMSDIVLNVEQIV